MQSKDKEEGSCDEKKEPIDKCYIVHILFFLIGLCHNVPFTFFTNATDYWMYKLRDVNSNYTDSIDNRTTLQTYFASAATIASTIPLVIFMLLTTVYGDLIKCTTRVKISMCVMVSTFIISTGFITLNTDTWQLQFFIVSMLLIVIANAANAIFGVSALVIISKFPKNILNSFLTGQGLSGILVSLLQIASLATGTSSVTSALIYFISGCTILMVTLILYVLSTKINYYQCFIQKPLKGCKKHVVGVGEMKRTLKLIWTSVLIFFLTSTTTSCTTPAITNLVVSEFAGKNDWGDKYFVSVSSYFLSNASDLVGRSIAPLIKFRINGKILCAIAFVRMIILVPLIMLCNARPRNNLPVVFPHDYQFIIIVILFGLTRGYFYSAAFLNVRRLVDPCTLEICLSMLITCAGISSGVSSPLSFLAVRIL